MRYRTLWVGLAAVVVWSFGLLGYYGWEIYRKAPPVPDRVETASGRVVFTGEQIEDGQNVWQSMGGQEVGSVWGHGGYVAPDWSADRVHREAVWVLDRWAASEDGKSYDQIGDEAQAALRARLRKELRANRYDPARRQALSAFPWTSWGVRDEPPRLGRHRHPEQAAADPKLIV